MGRFLGRVYQACVDSWFGGRVSIAQFLAIELLRTTPQVEELGAARHRAPGRKRCVDWQPRQRNCPQALPTPTCRRRDLEYPPDARQRRSAVRACRRGCGACDHRSSCPHRSRAPPYLFRRLDRLAIDDAGVRIALSLRRLAKVAVELIVNTLPGAVLLPRRDVVVQRLPLGQVMRNQSPRSSNAQNIRRCLESPAVRISLAALRAWVADQILDDRVFFIQIHEVVPS